METLPTVPCCSFYRKNRGPQIVVLPPEDAYVSDVGSSSDEEMDDSDLDPNFEPQSLLPHVPTETIEQHQNEDDEYDTDDEIPLSIRISNVKESNQKNRKKVGSNYNWVKENFQRNKIPIESEYEAPPNVLTPLQYFQMFWDDSITQYIAEQTCLYSTFTTGTSINTSSFEIITFIGIEILMGIIRMPSFEVYWLINTRYSIIADVMPIKRLKKLRRLIHFQDNSVNANQDRLFKIRYLLERIRSNCNKTVGENQYSIDEKMISYKGTKTGNLRQYLPKKPRKWGFKMFVRAGLPGIVYDFFIYTESSTFDHMVFSEK
ncbi:uncharacterized protein [Diabrotica undecimpunctata]|uniref:uncharacterized protein n=1 Tax=Diabrotica undecimpunctata TaxID=50387 RepID=UPI003B642782